MIKYRGVRVLITGDLDEEGERRMIEYYETIGRPGALKCDVLNLGHHGSKTSTSDAFLDAARPKLAVIQVGRNNYGHPSPEVLDRLKERGIRYFRNDLNGAIGIRITKKGIKGIHTMLG